VADWAAPMKDENITIEQQDGDFDKGGGETKNGLDY
jgi:hypothetical protein